MTPPTPPPPSPAAAPSALRTGLRAGAAFTGAVVQGGLLAVFLGGGLFLWHVLRLDGAGAHAGHAGGFGAIVALLTSPPLLVAVLLLLFVPLYIVLGLARGRSRALQAIVAAHGDAVATRIATLLAGRIAARPRLAAALDAAPERLSVDALSGQLAPVLGTSRLVRAALGLLLRRLPMRELIAAEAPPGADPASPADDGRSPLARRLQVRILGALRDASTPSWRLLQVALVAHALLFAFGWWITRPGP